MNIRHEEGFSLIAIVMVLLMIGVLIMNALHQQLSQQIRITQDERLYIQAHNRALSALAWGIQLQWHQPAEAWLCQQKVTDVWLTCIKRLDDMGNMIVKGESHMEGLNKAVTLYQLVSVDEDKSSELDVVLQRSPVGWLDFCPLESRQC